MRRFAQFLIRKSASNCGEKLEKQRVMFCSYTVFLGIIGLLIFGG